MILVKTKIEEIKPHYITFFQEIIDKNNPAKVFVTAHVKCAGVTAEGKLFKALPDLLEGKYK
jgi:acyl-CoA thioesterase FadM